MVPFYPCGRGLRPRPAAAVLSPPVDLSAAVRLAYPPPAVFAEVRVLDGYPAWLGLVESADVAPDRDQAAWVVTVVARLGPVRRAKQVRMVRVLDQPPTVARFERVELDGRAHSPWVLTATVEPDGTGSRLTVHLHYGGGLRLPFLDLLVRDEAARAGPRLAARLAAQAG
jgi:hypothetical protein